MNKKILVILLVVAIPVYLWDAWIVFGHRMNTQPEPAGASHSGVAEELTLKARIAVFTPRGKSPLSPVYVAAEPVKKVVVVPKSSPVVEVKPVEVLAAPTISISGIMWNPSNPVAMVTLPDGSSGIAKAGSVLGDITVVGVDKDQIRIVYKSKSFVIKR